MYTVSRGVLGKIMRRTVFLFVLLTLPIGVYAPVKLDRFHQEDYKVIIWDLGDTLFSVNRLGFMWDVGPRDLVKYILFDRRNPFRLQDELFSLLNYAEEDDDDGEIAAYSQGRILPAVMCSWLEGKKDGNDVYRQVVSAADEIAFATPHEKVFLLRLLKYMFNSHELAAHSYPIRPGVNLLKKCARVRDAQGVRKYRFMILSNLDRETYNSLREKTQFHIIFKYFDENDIVLSADVGCVKPNPRIYQQEVIERFGLDAKTCIFIDDEFMNVKAARACGMTALHLKDGDYHRLEKELRKLGVFDAS